MRYDKPITVQVQNFDTEEWTDALKLHARVNTNTGSTASSAGTDTYKKTLKFTVRYVKALEDISYNPQPFRILYRGHAFKVTDYDDYMEQHREVTMVGEFYE